MASDGDGSLGEYIAPLARAYQLTPAEESLVLDLALAHDMAQQLLTQVLEEALEQGNVDPGPEVFQAATPGIIDALTHGPLPDRRDLALLAEPRVAEACATALLGSDSASILGMQLLVHALRPAMPHQALVAVEWLDGRARERAGFALEAEDAFTRAAGLNPSWIPVLESLAGMAFDRGDVERALSLFERAGVDEDDSMYQFLLSYRTPEVLSLRRNDPCWCGSGRKLKQCHRRADQLPLSRRATWLYQKAALFLRDGPYRAEILELAEERSRYSDNVQDLYAALTDVVVEGSMLFEGEVLHDFIESRGPLLPTDERELVQRWAATRRGLFEVEAVEVGRGLHVRNVLDGERIFVTEVLGSREAYPGMLFVSLALPLDNGAVDNGAFDNGAFDNGADETGAFGFFGGIEPVSLTQRADVITLLDADCDPLDIVALLTDRYAPVRFTTTDGEPLEQCTVVLKIKGRKLIDRAFDKQFTRSDDATWVASSTGGLVDEGGSVGGLLEVQARTVTLTTLSRRRADVILDAITDIGLEFEIVEEYAVDVAEAARTRDAVTAPPPPDDPAMAELLEQVIATYEAEWLDTSIPALEGLTPREAAADPLARRDLIALINSFPAPAPGTMDRDRLRAALDL